MVDPIAEEDRLAFTRKLQLGLTGLVGLSGGLVGVQADGSPMFVAGGAVAGLLVGAALAWVVVPSNLSPRARQRERQRAAREDPFETTGDSDGSDEDRQRAPEQSR